MQHKETYPIAEKFFIGPLWNLLDGIRINGDAYLSPWIFPRVDPINDLNEFLSFFIDNLGTGRKLIQFEKSVLKVLEGSLQKNGSDRKSLAAGFFSLDAFYWVDKNFNLFRRFADQHNSLYIVDVANLFNHPNILQKILEKSGEFLLRPSERQVQIIKERVGAKTVMPLEERNVLYPFLFDFFQEAKKYEDGSVGIIFVCQSDCGTKKPFSIEVDDERSFIVVEACFRVMGKTMNKVIKSNNSDNSDDAVAIELYRRLKSPNFVKCGIVSFDLFFEYQGSLFHPVSFNPEEFFFTSSSRRGFPLKLQPTGSGRSLALRDNFKPRDSQEAPLLFSSEPTKKVGFGAPTPRVSESHSSFSEKTMPLSFTPTPRVSESHLSFSEKAKPSLPSLERDHSEIESRGSGTLHSVRAATSGEEDALEKIAFSASRIRLK